MRVRPQAHFVYRGGARCRAQAEPRQRCSPRFRKSTMMRSVPPRFDRAARLDSSSFLSILSDKRKKGQRNSLAGQLVGKSTFLVRCGGRDDCVKVIIKWQMAATHIFPFRFQKPQVGPHARTSLVMLEILKDHLSEHACTCRQSLSVSSRSMLVFTLVSASSLSVPSYCRAQSPSPSPRLRQHRALVAPSTQLQWQRH